MKKAVIAASACFVAGLIGCTISLPMVAKDVIHLYNDTVSETANFYTTQDLPAGITELRMCAFCSTRTRSLDPASNVVIRVTSCRKL